MHKHFGSVLENIALNSEMQLRLLGVYFLGV